MTPFIEAFRAVVRAHGERVAIESPGATVTYAELWQGAEESARAHRPGELVELAAERSPAYVTALLGVWMADAAFVPMDPETPAARLALVRTQLDRARSLREELAYVIFTSGSTGRPKGVRVGHAGLVPLLRAQIELFGLGPGKRSLFFLSPCFDASLSDIGTALLSGATLVIDDAYRLRTSLREVLADRRITHADLPPARAALFDPAELPASLETLILGGEACDPARVRALAARVRVVNVYGPTEATICTSMVRCDADTWRAPSLGHPVPGVRYLVEDGELLIGGPCVALGYVDEPELTAARFVMRQGERYFRTGDRVEARADGELVFEGRVDRQCKIHGALVAPEEVERCLAAVPGVSRVHVGPEPEGGGRLCAFVAPAVSEDALRAAVAASLPKHMHPAHFYLREALPQTASGKVDAAALWRERGPETPPEARGSHRVAQLQALVARVLGIGLPSPSADFFALGGDSLSVLELVAAAEAEGIALSAAQVYADGTVAAMAVASEPAPMPVAQLRADVEQWLGTVPGGAREASDVPFAKSLPQEPVCVLVTGAFGFLGTALRAELAPGTRVLGLARRAPSAPTETRVLLGDVTAPRMGLDAQTWAELADTVDSVFHLAADVNLVKPYAELRAAHLGSLGPVLELLRTGRPKRLHLASTLSVVACQSPLPAVACERALDGQVELHGGYAQSKWAAEHAIRDVQDAQIVRFGLLTGHAQTGRAAPHCHLMMCIRGLRELGCIPEAAEDALVDVTPIDHAAATLARIANSRETGVFHVCGAAPLALSSLVAALHDHGIHLRTVSAEAFRARAREVPQTRAVATTLASLQHRFLGGGSRASDLFLATGIAFDAARTVALTGPAPSPTPALLRTYLEAMDRP
jgi:thioester reductase-like protein